jgi:hypothetical protein
MILTSNVNPLSACEFPQHSEKVEACINTGLVKICGICIAELLVLGHSLSEAENTFGTLLGINRHVLIKFYQKSLKRGENIMF